MKISITKLVIFICLFNLTFSLFSQESENKEEDRMKWWREARFGMFIHWGVYSVFENVYNGMNVKGEQVHYDMRNSMTPSEWIMRLALIPRSIYREAAKEFDVKDYDPKKWVQIAKDAGMKYIVITSKHHDGFCLFDSQYTDWDAIDASPAGKDLLSDLVYEAKAAGLKIGFYYSQNLDWMHEGGMSQIPELNDGFYSDEKVREYVNYLVIPHINELASKYDFDIMWFDGQYAENINVELNQSILQALKNSPVGNRVLTNDRLYNGFQGDFITPETDTPDIPYNGFPDNRDWEACASLNNSWGYEGLLPDTYWKSPLFTMGRILELSSKGGNFLLNVGPDKHGVIPEEAVNTLKRVGEWMQKNGDAVYGTEKNALLNPFEYGYVTQKTEPNGSLHWYLHVSSGYWNEMTIYLCGIKELPQSAIYSATGENVDIELINNTLAIHLPEECPDPYYTTIDLHFEKLPEQIPLSQIRNQQIRLTPYQAVTSGGIRKDFLPCAFKEWYLKNCEVRYNVYLETGVYSIQTEYSAYDDGELYFKINGSTYTGYYSKTKDMDTYITEDLSNIEIIINKPGVYQMTITRNAEISGHFNIINVRNFVLKKTVNAIINPVKDGCFICKLPVGKTVHIYDIAGRRRKSVVIREDNKVDVSDLNPGVYIVKGNYFTEKIIIYRSFIP
jgi:alpha-L-fucosidase